jgi:hypothetical protein
LDAGKIFVVEVSTAGQQFQAGIPKELFEIRLSPEVRRNRYLVSKDGQRFLVNAFVDQGELPTVRVVLNWAELLNR